ncbi:MAG TPA: hypothetical protein VHW95_03245, partial [Steroidobacteraceae bacterium]|nr:hypothetical protein [Steroidobacteraceae bacterium]
MFSDNPFAALSATISPDIMQIFVAIMIALVLSGTLFDIVHKKSARYFFNNWRETKREGTQPVGGGKMAALAVRTAAVEVLAAGEFCSTQRRIAHLLTMYGFLAYVTATLIMVFWYSTLDAPTPDILPQIWHIGALLVCVGGYWFWFFIRVDVSAEGHSPFRVVRADLFVLSLVASTTLALIWSWLQSAESSWANFFL